MGETSSRDRSATREQRGFCAGKGRSASPPPDHPHRCQGNRTTRGLDGELRRCKRWARRGERFCKKHMRYLRQRNNQSDLRDSQKITRELPAVYSRVLGDSLASRVRELAARPPAEQADNSELLSLAQLTAVDAAQLYDAACLAADKLAAEHPERAVDALNSKLAVGQLMRDVAAEVIDITRAAMAARELPRSLVTVADVQQLMTQVVRAAHESFGESDPAAVEKFAERVAEARLLATSSGRAGTTVTPDQDAAAMDATVPRVGYGGGAEGGGDVSGGREAADSREAA